VKCISGCFDVSDLFHELALILVNVSAERYILAAEMRKFYTDGHTLHILLVLVFMFVPKRQFAGKSFYS
jgi:hypothetical protein